MIIFINMNIIILVISVVQMELIFQKIMNTYAKKHVFLNVLLKKFLVIYVKKIQKLIKMKIKLKNLTLITIILMKKKKLKKKIIYWKILNMNYQREIWIIYYQM